MSTRKQYIATGVGCGIGDTLGMSVEGFKRAQIQKYVGRITEPMAPFIVRDAAGNRMDSDEFGELGYYDQNKVLRYYTEDLELGEFTDDTINYVAIAEALAERGLDLQSVAEKRLVAYNACILPDGHTRGGFGQTTTAGMKNLQQGISPLESGVIGGPGNAPAMMLHGLGLYADATGKYDQSLQFAELVGRMTHLDPRSLAGGVVQTHAIYSLLQGVNRKEFVSSLVDICRKYEKPATSEFSLHGWGSLVARLEWIQQNKDATGEAAYLHITPSSTAYCSHPFALFMFQKIGMRTLLKA